MRLKAGVVSEKEKNTIRELYERKTALQELFITLKNQALTEDEKNFLYDKLVEDMGKTETAFQLWWDEKTEKYNWQQENGAKLLIDFKTNEIFLEKGACCNC